MGVCLQFFHLLERGEITNPLDFDDVLDDIREECSQHGFVEAVHILKPIDEDKDGAKKHQLIDVRSHVTARSIGRALFDAPWLTVDMCALVDSVDRLTFECVCACVCVCVRAHVCSVFAGVCSV